MQFRYTIGTRTRARGVEPRKAVLEAAGSPRSTLVFAAHPTMGSQGIRRESNPYFLVHSQACSDRYTTDTMFGPWHRGATAHVVQSTYAIRVNS